MDTPDKIPVECPDCGKALRVGRNMAGKHGKCPGCGADIPVPSAGAPAGKAGPRRGGKHRKTTPHRAKQTSPGPLLWLLVGGAAVAGVAAVVVTGALLLRGGSRGKPPPTVAEIGTNPPVADAVAPAVPGPKTEGAASAAVPPPRPAEPATGRQPTPPPGVPAAAPPVVKAPDPVPDAAPLIPEQARFTAGRGEVRFVALAPRGRLALAVQGPPPRRDTDPPLFPAPGMTIITQGDSLLVWDLQAGEPVPVAPKDFSFTVKDNGSYAAAGFLDGERQAAGILHNGDTLVYQVNGAAPPRVLRVGAFLGGQDKVPSAFDGPNVLLPDGLCGFQLFDLTTGKGSTSFIGHANEVTSLALTPDRKRVLSAGGDGSVRLWDFQTGKELHRLDRESQPGHVVALGDNRHAVFFWNYDVVQLWDLDPWQEVRHWDPPAGLNEYRLTGPGRHVQFSKGTAGITSVAAVPGERQRVLLGCRDGSIRLWDLETDRECLFYPQPGESAAVPGRGPARDPVPSVGALAVAADGRRFVSGHGDGALRVWQVPAEGQFARFAVAATRVPPLAPAPRPGLPVRVVRFGSGLSRAVAFSPDGKVLTASQLHAAAEAPAPTAPGGKVRPAPGFPPRLQGADVQSTVQLWNMDPVGEVLRIRVPAAGISTVALSPGGRYALGGPHDPFGGDAVLHRWDLQTGKPAGQWPATALVGALAFSPDGKRAACGGAGPVNPIVDPRTDYAVTVWDLAGGRHLACTGHLGPVNSVAFSPRGDLLVSAAGGTTFGMAAPPQPGMSADDSIRIWDARTGKELHRLAGHAGGSLCAVFSPDGKYVLSGGADKALRLWDSRTGKQIAEMKGHEGAVRRVAISPDGKRAVSGGWVPDKHVLCWDLETRAVTDRFEFIGQVAGVGFSADSKEVQAAREGEIFVWRLKQ